MRKRLRRDKGLCCCSSPRCDFHGSSSYLCWDEDIWTHIAKFLDGKSLVKLALTSKWFHGVIMHDSVWKFACLRDLQVPDSCHVSFKWAELYASAFDGSHSFMFRQQDKHLDWMRIGAFLLNSQEALLCDKLNIPAKVRKEITTEKLLKPYGSHLLKNVKTGIWIADLQLVRCPACNLDTCEGTMQMLDARHIELFLNEDFQEGSWDYELIEAHKSEKNVEGAAAAIFDVKHLKDSELAGLFNIKTWAGKDLQPKAIIAFHAVAVNTNLQKNEGVLVKYHAMKAGASGDIVSIRISHQLL